jgi:phage terminase small subunit
MKKRSARGAGRQDNPMPKKEAGHPIGHRRFRGNARETTVVPSASAAPSPVQTSFSPPKHLLPDTAAWWREVAKQYALEAHGLRLLTLACEAWDRGVEAREAIAKYGTIYVDRFDQPRARPEVAIERDSRLSFARLVRELALDVEPPDEPGRPPRLSGAVPKRGPDPGWDEDDRRILGLN